MGNSGAKPSLHSEHWRSSSHPRVLRRVFEPSVVGNERFVGVQQLPDSLRRAGSRVRECPEGVGDRLQDRGDGGDERGFADAADHVGRGLRMRAEELPGGGRALRRRRSASSGRIPPGIKQLVRHAVEEPFATGVAAPVRDVGHRARTLSRLVGPGLTNPMNIPGPAGRAQGDFEGRWRRLFLHSSDRFEEINT